ncbi:DNA-processing protein DprA [Paenibacillus farraposensis]|uniref:DNA-processing protein DprA n=1 Tax=Paenibacillus farraposensis TaxID=2807095 RepID=A0ABW4D8X6_9BACL|nr:DNA-processing protein DprA [Paenibacillus farraposensis]MCC3381363.1 DNA-processing protein DprA [Paenibacillus farraposensis]
MEERWLLLGLHELEGIGRKTIQRIWSSDYRLHELLQFSEQKWIDIGLSPAQARIAAQCYDEEWVHERYRRSQTGDIGTITYVDEDYPLLMKETVDPPWVMYTKGDKSLLHTCAVAMVGTRVPTAYGRRAAEILTEGLCHAGITVVSGLAKGIDSICHETALRRGGKTIGVLGTAIDQIYPPQNAFLFAEMASKGLIVSEYPPGTRSHPGMFPQRNRIIAGLTRGTLVVEADARSGSLITADAALEANRDVFAVPGPITSPKSRGTLNLIKQGAKTVTEASDIIEEYTADLRTRDVSSYNREQSRDAKVVPSTPEHETSEENRIVLLLEQGTMTLDELLEATAWDFGLLHAVLLSLIIKKRIAQLAGTKYKLI